MPPPTPPELPESKKGKTVHFTSPNAVDGTPREGVIIDEVWHGPIHDAEWGWYAYTAQIIQWANGEKSARLTYYYQPEGSKKWIFGGQYSIEESLPEMINFLSKATNLISNI